MEWDFGEFLCPLCECYGNTVLPLLPEVGQLSVGAEPVEPSREVKMKEWKELLSLAVDLGSDNAMDTGKCSGGTENCYSHIKVLHTYWKQAWVKWL